ARCAIRTCLPRCCPRSCAIRRGSLSVPWSTASTRSYVTRRLVQMRVAGERYVAMISDDGARRIKHSSTTYALAQAAIAGATTIEAVVERSGYSGRVDVTAALEAGQILAPIDHADPARVWLTGTGLTHLGSADARDKMHAKAHASDASDSMKMFRMG